MEKNYLLLITALLIFITACHTDDYGDSDDLSNPFFNPIDSSSIANLDQALTDSLVANCRGFGLDFFKLPDDGDFAHIPQDPRNRITGAKVRLGQSLFHETGLGRNPKRIESINMYSCASCHHVDAEFHAGIAQGIGEGGIGFGIRGETRKKKTTYADTTVDVQAIRSPTVLNVLCQELMLWNGQFGATGQNVGTENAWTAGTPKEKNWLGYQGIETQAIAGQGVHRLKIDRDYLSSLPAYVTMFAEAFPSLPASQRMTDINAGLAIAAYERTLIANQAPFQKWLRGNITALSTTEKRGAVLFFGKAGCVKCHTGPALNDMAFYALGMNDLLTGVKGAVNAGADKPEHKGRGGFTGRTEDMFKFKVPQLYNLRNVKFLGHGAQFSSVLEVLNYKNRGIASNRNVPTTQLATDFKPLNLTSQEIEQLRLFVENALYDPNLKRFVPQSLPSGFCFPNNDPQSKLDKGCQ